MFTEIAPAGGGPPAGSRWVVRSVQFGFVALLVVALARVLTTGFGIKAVDDDDPGEVAGEVAVPAPPPAVCSPDCTGKDCGDDGCGGSCGACAGSPGSTCVDGRCVCEPRCEGGRCGDDGCGGTCPACPGGRQCAEGWCVCAGEVCGEACCSPGTTCYAGSCCTPSCEGRECGDDSCGGSCGTCSTASPACRSGRCVAVCHPDCGGRSCGDDGCGGSCGSCPSGTQCVGGSCRCVPACGGRACGDDGCGGSCGSCPAGAVCSGGACGCVPACSGRSCGPDGCGGTCGACATGLICSSQGACVCPGLACGGWCCGSGQVCAAGACCSPSCAQRSCGDDGCGGSCGTCSGNARCQSHRCVSPEPVERVYPRSRIAATASSSDATVVGKNDPDVTYYPSNALDGDLSTAWAEGKKGHGIGEWISLRFDGAIRVSKLRIWNGYQKYVDDRLQDRYWINERLKKIRVSTDDVTMTFTLADTKASQDLDLEGTQTRSLRVEILSLYEAEYPDAAISDMEVYYLSE
ncbi:MAG: discoidin domain-containing protein [Pseudomonadota bacterium]